MADESVIPCTKSTTGIDVSRDSKIETNPFSVGYKSYKCQNLIPLGDTDKFQVSGSRIRWGEAVIMPGTYKVPLKQSVEKVALPLLHSRWYTMNSSKDVVVHGSKVSSAVRAPLAETTTAQLMEGAEQWNNRTPVHIKPVKKQEDQWFVCDDTEYSHIIEELVLDENNSKQILITPKARGVAQYAVTTEYSSNEDYFAQLIAIYAGESGAYNTNRLALTSYTQNYPEGSTDYVFGEQRNNSLAQNTSEIMSVIGRGSE